MKVKKGIVENLSENIIDNFIFFLNQLKLVLCSPTKKQEEQLKKLGITDYSPISSNEAQIFIDCFTKIEVDRIWKN